MGDEVVPPAATPQEDAFSEGTWARSDSVYWRVAGSTLVVLGGRDGDGAPNIVYGSGAVLWEILERPISLAELGEELSARYGVPRAIIAEDVSPVLEQLSRLGLIHKSP
ncbi:MAG: PqqD family protein [Acidimicrobiales bacterium]